jgi:hypothetical protein
MSVNDIRKQTADKMGGHACLLCRAPTSHETMATYGARCFPCFQQYCREPAQQHPRSPQAERIRAEIAAMGRRVPA